MRKNGILKLITILCLIAGIMLTACACNGGEPAETKGTEKPTETPTEKPTEEPTESESSSVSYKVTVIDGNGDALKGATVQLCIGELCQLPVMTGDDGVAVVEAEKDTYTVKVTLQGYVGEASYSFPEGSNELTVILNLIPGSNAQNPIWFTEPNNDITVPAGQIVYYTGRFGNCTMKLYGRDVTVTYNGTDYTPDSNFIVTIELGALDFNNPPVFAIKNTADSEGEYTVKYIYPAGSRENPAALVIGENTATVAEDSQGYFFTWTAEADGEITLTIAEDCTNWAYTLNNITAHKYGTNVSSDNSDAVKTYTVEISAGDEIEVIIGSADHKAATVDFTVSVAFNG